MVPAHYATDMAWKNCNLGNDSYKTWSWGIQVRIRDFKEAKLKTLVIPVLVGQVLGGRDYTANTLLLRGNWDDAFGGITKLYIFRPMNIDPNVDLSRKIEIKISENACLRPGAPPVALETAAVDLDEKKNEFLNVRQNDAKATFNVTDNPGLIAGARLVVGEKDSVLDHRRLEQEAGPVVMKPGASQKKVRSVPCVLEEHGVEQKSSLAQSLPYDYKDNATIVIAADSNIVYLDLKTSTAHFPQRNNHNWVT